LQLRESGAAAPAGGVFVTAIALEVIKGLQQLLVASKYLSGLFGGNLVDLLVDHTLVDHPAVNAGIRLDGWPRINGP